jgi:hypothetical protein
MHVSIWLNCCLINQVFLSCLLQYLGTRVASNRPLHISLEQSVLLFNAEPGKKMLQSTYSVKKCQKNNDVCKS